MFAACKDVQRGNWYDNAMVSQTAVHYSRNFHRAARRPRKGSMPSIPGEIWFAGEAARSEELTTQINPELVLLGNEIVILMVRPSLWYVLAKSFRFNAIIILFSLLAYHMDLLSRYVH